jgi:glycosyltransferase involved in cell wall biosynthesis
MASDDGLPIRVTHIAKTVGHGGVAVGAADWCSAMARHGIESRMLYVADREHARIAEEFARRGIPCRVTSGTSAALREVMKLRVANLARVGTPRILHVHTGLAVIRRSADALRRLAGSRSPSVMSLYGPSAMVGDDPQSPAWVEHRRLAGLWDVVTAPSAFEAEVQARMCDATAPLACVKFCCEATPPEPGSLRAMLGVDEREVLLTSIGRLHMGQKDPATLIDAFAIVAPQVERTRLVLIGDGEDRAFLEAKVRALPPAIAARVHLVGHVQAPARLLADAFAFLAASRAESFGLVAYEAALAGTPLVLAAIQPWQSMFDDGDESLFFAPGDAGTLAEHVLGLLREPARARAMAARAQARARRDSDPDAIGRTWREIYAELLVGESATTRPRG